MVSEMKVLIMFGLTLLFVLARSQQFYILHTNDFHSHYEMFSASSKTCDITKMKPDDKKTICYGGAARLSGFVKKFRKEHKNVLLLDAGDQYQGTLWFNVFFGNLTKYFVHYMMYDAMALGNHEFDNTPSGLIPLLINESNPTILCANIRGNEKQKVHKNLKQYVLKTVANTSVAIIGYLTPEVQVLARTENFTFQDEILAIKEVVKNITDTQKIIIALGHSGIDKDKEIAKAIPEIDIVIGGHTHTLLYNGNNEYGDKVEGEYPIVINHDGGGKTLVVTAGCHGKYMGLLNVTFDSDGKLTEWSGNPVIIDSETPEDELLSGYLTGKRDKIDSVSEIPVGNTTDMFDTSDRICRVKECSLGNLFADALVKTIHDLCKWSNFTLAIMNGGGIRASFAKGGITYGDVMSVFPFGNQMVMATVDGATLLQVFEHSVKDFSLTSKHGKFLQVSGFKVKYDLSKPNGERVAKLEVKNCFECPEYVDVDTSKKYEVAMPSFIAGGGDGYAMLKTARVRSYDILEMEVIVGYFANYSPLTPKVEDRITGMETFDKDSFGAPTAALQSFAIAVFSIISILVSVCLHLSNTF